MDNIGITIFRFLILAILQVVVINNLYLGGYINPFPYILVILMLPPKFPRWALLLTGFFLGYLIDSFSGGSGLHTAACVFIAFCKPSVIRLISLPNNFDEKSEINLRTIGMENFLKYALILTLIHHLSYFFLEAFGVHEFFRTLLRVVLSTIVTIALMLAFLFFSQSHKK